MLCCNFRVSSGVGMYDFTWKSLFRVYGIALAPLALLAPGFTSIWAVLAVAGGLLILSTFLYIAIAPILAYAVNSYRETGSALQTGKRLLGLFAAMLLAAGALALLHLGSEASKAWLADKPWGWIVSGLFGLLVMFGYALNFYDAYRTRKQINSLNTYTPSNRTDVRIK